MRMGMANFKRMKTIQNIEDKYVMGQNITTGSFGPVKQCKHKETKKLLAVKILSKEAIRKQ